MHKIKKGPRPHKKQYEKVAPEKKCALLCLEAKNHEKLKGNVFLLTKSKANFPLLGA